MKIGLLALLGIGLLAAVAVSAVDPAEPFHVIVVDAGHGGPDFGARGRSGVLEKDLVLQVSLQIGAALEDLGLKVVYTRKTDHFLTLPERAQIANRARGHLFLSVHANSASDREARGPETYFLSLQATDQEALRVAQTENRVFDQPAAVPDSDDIVGRILGDLIVFDHLRGSSEIAGAIQRQVARVTGRGRGVKQAPFVVLSGVNMPAVLLELGFITNKEEARALGRRKYRQAIAQAVARAVGSYRDALPRVAAKGEAP